MRIKAVFKHSAQALAEGSLVALLVVGLMAGSVLAAKPEGSGQGKPGGGGTGGTLAIVMVTDVNADGLPNRADTVTFAVSTSAARPFVSVNCYQGSTWVYNASVGFFPDYPWSRDFTLATTSWTEGGADCSAKLYTTKDGVRITTLATLAFTAGS